MSIINDKKEIFGDIAALNTINDGLPKLNKTSSLESASNSKDPMKFLADVLVVLAECFKVSVPSASKYKPCKDTPIDKF